ncbi:uncharacterized protein LOC129806611 [Phlebotomus papatasi]|uniref:uncharacterized protein LOC129806611 n=1 Tax=Phlebotomus papatasi TaxID=29031 RepID=UPI0024843A88|nr:uncharacterized protein LOC129806611 [Phlebotomus papatasi]
MVRITIYLALFAILGISAYSAELPQELPAEVKVVERIEDFLSENPGEALVELQPELRAQTRFYTLGRRVSGDRHVAYARGVNSYPSLRDVTATVRYSGAIITYIQVSVTQTSNLGRVYTTSGGIGQRSIVFVVEARSTLQFNYNVDIYGRN